MKRYLAINLLLIATMSQSAWSAVGFGGGRFSMSLDVAEVVLPDANPVGSYRGDVQVNAVILADGAHSIGINFDGFRNEQTGVLYTDNMTLQVDNKAVLRPGQMGVLCSADRPTPSGGVNLPLSLRFCVDEVSRLAAGRYRCITSLVIMASP